MTKSTSSAKTRPEAENFSGLPPELFEFLAGLEADNTKEYWQANRDTYTEFVKNPVEALKDELAVEFGPIKGFRPNRDVRFSKDKTPYKTWVGFTTTERAVGGVGSFWQATADGIKLATGAMMLESDQLSRYRDALIDDRAGAEFDRLRADLAEKKLQVGPGDIPQYKRTPSGYPKEHPRSAELHWKGAIVIKSFDRAKWMYTRELVKRIREVWAGAEPLLGWFENHVGPSTKPSRRR